MKVLNKTDPRMKPCGTPSFARDSAQELRQWIAYLKAFPTPSSDEICENVQFYNTFLPFLCRLEQWCTLRGLFTVFLTAIRLIGTVTLTVFRSNSKFDQNFEYSSLKYDQPIKTKFYTLHDSYTVVFCAKFRYDG